MAKNPESSTNPGGNLWDALFGEIGRAVSDIRDKAVLEPWFGPTGGGYSGPSPSPSHSLATQSVAEELGWVKSDRENATPTSPAPDHRQGVDFDR